MLPQRPAALLHHSDVGDIDLDYDALEVPADPGLTSVTYTPAPTRRHVAAFARLRGRDSAERQTSVLIPGADRKVHRRLRRPCSPSDPVRHAG
ncbi:hypothetical protein ACN6LA_001473 [Streptomyces sp. SAS_269]|uniref:MmyB family transcriptional regulator n=1 Tax=Streptomyces sp. SAS_269 TaxID=3412749 RepID=UPI00403D2B68